MRKNLLLIISFLSLLSFGQGSSFTKVFGGSSEEAATRVIQLTSGDYYILSTTESYGVGNKDILVTKTNGLGDIIWSYAFGTSGNEVATSMKLASDGGLLITGYSDNIATNGDAGIVLKLSSSGSVTWNKTIVYDSTVRANDIVESRFGGYFVTGTMYLDSLDDNVFVTSMSSTGNFFWTKTYGGINKDEAYSITEDGIGRLVIAGSTMNDSVVHGSAGDKDIQVLRMRTNGNLIWVKNYGTSDIEEATFVRTDNSSNIYLTGYTVGGAIPGENMILTKLDSSGSVSSSYIFGATGDDRGHSLTFASNGDVRLVGKMQGVSSGADVLLIRTTSAGVISNSTIIGGDSLDGISGVSSFQTSDGGVTIVSSGQSLVGSSNNKLYMMKTEENGNIACGTKLDFVDAAQYSLSSSSHQNTGSVSAGANLSLSNTTVSLGDSVLCCQLQARVAANSISMCTGDQIRLGKAAISGYQYSWTANNTSFTSSAANPLVSPTSDIIYKLVVTDPEGNCIADSAFVNVTVSTRLNVDFARDTFFCQGQNVSVSAYPNQNSYLWTGTGYSYSTNPATFNTEDTVVLTVIDVNSCIYRDTIVITEIPTPVFSLGADTTICSNVPITLEGPDDMFSYTWNGQAGSQTYTTNTQQVHTLAVVDSFGCTYNDNIVIQTKPYSTFNLGPDSSLCVGSPFTIFGPGALTGYIWNDTASSQQNLVVFKGGTYHLTAYNSFGCPYSDTITLSEYQLPVFSLGNDTGYCEGGAILLSGPNNAEDYLWSNGRTTDTSSFFSEGNATLRITDVNGCRYTDTIAIEEYENPDISLGPDTTICLGESIVLSPGAGFSAYTWSTSSTQSSITVSAKGSYSVTVTDANGCDGSATVNVDTVTCNKESIQFLGAAKVSMYPNPASQYIQLESEVSLMGAELKLIDSYGKLVLKQVSNSHQPSLNISNLPNGVYQLGIEKDNKQIYYRVIVSH